MLPMVIIRALYDREEIMSAQPHVERHFRSNEMVRDIVIGMSDGFTVPFALAAGISGVAGAQTKIVVLAGLARLLPGLSPWAWGVTWQPERIPSITHRKSAKIGRSITCQSVKKKKWLMCSAAMGWMMCTSSPSWMPWLHDREQWLDFMMRFELGLEAPDPKRARSSALTIGLSYVVGGFIPLTPYILIPNLTAALLVSVVVTLIALFVFGYIKGRFTGTKPLRIRISDCLGGWVGSWGCFFDCQVDWIGSMMGWVIMEIW